MITEQTQVADAVKAYDAAYKDALRDPSGHHDLSTVAIGDVLTRANNDIAQYVHEGATLRAKKPSVSRDAVYDIKISGDTATATGCEVSDDLLVDAKSGQVRGAAVTTVEGKVSLRRVAGEGWRVSTVTSGPGQTWQGVAGCALAH